MTFLDEAFIKATLDGDLDEARRLVRQGANMDAIMDDNGECTLLHRTTSTHYSPATARFLLRNGANVDAIDRHSQTALHWVGVFGHVEGARLLVEFDADVNCRDAHGNTPLHIGCPSSSYERIVHFLLQSGADVTIRNDAGQSALDIAHRRRSDGIVAVLETHIAETRTRIQEKLQRHETFKSTIIRGFSDPNSLLNMLDQHVETSTWYKTRIAEFFGAPTSGEEVRRLRSEREELRLLLIPRHP